MDCCNGTNGGKQTLQPPPEVSQDQVLPTDDNRAIDLPDKDQVFPSEKALVEGVTAAENQKAAWLGADADGAPQLGGEEQTPTTMAEGQTPTREFLAVVLFLCLPAWVAPRFLRPGVTFTADEFKAACVADPDPELEDEAAAFGLVTFKRMVVSCLMAFLLPMTRVEKWTQTSPEEAGRMRKVRYYYYLPVVGALFMFRVSCDVYYGLQHTDIRLTAPLPVYLALLGCSIATVCLLMTCGMHQGMVMDTPWFARRSSAVCVGVVVSFVGVVATLSAVFANMLLSNPVQLYAYVGQFVIILGSKGMVFLAKQTFIRCNADVGMVTVCAYTISAGLEIPLRVFCLVQPTIGTLFLANMVNLLGSFGGQAVKYGVLKFGRTWTMRQVVAHDALFLWRLAINHMIDLVSLVLVLSSDPRYWVPSPLVGVSDTVNVGLVLLSFFLAECCEFIIDAMSFLVVGRALRASASGVLARTQRTKIVDQQMAVVLMLAVSIAMNPRVTCLFCGSQYPTPECYAD